jgi:ribosomal silencing factor RsfS
VFQGLRGSHGTAHGMRTFEPPKLTGMRKTKRPSPITPLVDVVVKGMQEIKAKDIVHLDLREVPGAVCDHFIICHGDSVTQVEAIARSVERFTMEQIRTKSPGTRKEKRTRAGYCWTMWMWWHTFSSGTCALITVWTSFGRIRSETLTRT